MIPFNTFSIHVLVGFMVTALLSIAFLLVYWKLGRHILDVILAALVACGAAACLADFLADNVIRAGADSATRPGAALATLWCIRLMYVLAIVSMPLQLHFVHSYCRRPNALSRHIRWVYAAFLATIPVTWSPHFLEIRREAIAATSSWTCAAPWQPRSGPLIIVFLAVWFAVQIYSLVLLGKHTGPADRSGSGSLGRHRLLHWAILLQAAGGLTACAAAAFGYAGPSVFSAGSVVAAIIIATAIVHDRIDADRDKQGVQRELELASRIQKRMLPQEDPLMAGFDAAGWSRPAAHAGGDTYDLFALPSERWMVTLADASGHGIGPALIISETRAMLRAFGMRCANATDVLHEARRLLRPDLADAEFVTCFLGLLDLGESVLSYASAGHGPIIFYDGETEKFHLERATHLPLPLISPLEQDSPPELRQHRFRPGDFLVLASDGFWEAIDAKGRQYGIERLLEVLRRARDLSVRQIIDLCRHEVDQFIAPGRQLDDLTMVILRKQ